MCACADGLNFKYSNLKMFLLKLGSEQQNFIIKILSLPILFLTLPKFYEKTINRFGYWTLSSRRARLYTPSSPLLWTKGRVKWEAEPLIIPSNYWNGWTIPGGNFVGIFWGGFTRRWSLMGGNFPRGSFPGRDFHRTMKYM